MQFCRCFLCLDKLCQSHDRGSAIDLTTKTMKLFLSYLTYTTGNLNDSIMKNVLAKVGQEDNSADANHQIFIKMCDSCKNVAYRVQQLHQKVKAGSVDDKVSLGAVVKDFKQFVCYQYRWIFKRPLEPRLNFFATRYFFRQKSPAVAEVYELLKKFVTAVYSADGGMQTI